MREIVGFACDQCKRKNYTSTKNRKTTTEKLSLKKFCASCRAIPCIVRLKSSEEKGSVAPIGRAPDSKSGCCRFESCLTRHLIRRVSHG